MEDRAKRIQSFEGAIAAVFTPFKSDGSLNLDAIGSYAKYLQDNNVKGIFISGTTGEFLSMNISERKQLVEKWITEGRKRLDLIIAHISTGSLQETKELARHAAEKGVDSIAALPPLYYTPSSEDELIRYLSEISASAPDTPLMYYNFPNMSGYSVQLHTLMPKIKKAIPNFVGVKYTSSDLRDLAGCRAKYGDEFKILLGNDELQLNGLVSGVNSSILITANLFPSLSNAIYAAYKDNDLKRAQANQNKLIRAIDNILKYGDFFPTFKAAMNLVSPIAVGPPRLPLTKHSEDSIQKLKDGISKMNLSAT